MGQAVLQVSPKSGSARGSCSTVSKNRTRGRLPFSVRMNRSAQPLPSGALTRAGELPAPRNASSSWKTADMHWPPWSWRTQSPAAAPLAKVPERWRTPWRSGASASKRVPCRAAWMPTHSALWWPAATSTATWPSRVQAVVMPMPHVMSRTAGMMVPPWLRGPRGVPTREDAGRACLRSSRSTASRLRCRDVRPPRPQPAASARRGSARSPARGTSGRGRTVPRP